MARPNVEVQRRAEIMRAACQVIASRGVVGLRIADVARAASVSPGIVHYYFDGKLALIRAAFEDNFARSLERRRAVFEADLGSVDTLHAVIESYLPVDAETVQAWHVWIELWSAALQDPELRDVNDRAYGQWRAIIEGIVAEGQQRGEVVGGDPTALANMLLGALDGLAVQVLVGSSGMDVATMRSVCRGLVERMSLSPPAPAAGA